MNYNNYEDLNLLPIKINMFGLAEYHDSSIPGTYQQGSFPSGRWVRVTIDCFFEPCFDTGAGPDYEFQGISTSSSTFTPPTSSYAFNKTIQDTGNYEFPYMAFYTLNTTETSLINQLSPGTYYVWYDGASRGTLTITSAVFTASTSLTKNFVIAGKDNNNPIRARLNWDNPTSTNYYYYAGLSTESSGVGSFVHGVYGPYLMSKGNSGSVNFSVEYLNTVLNSDTRLFLLSYKSTSSTWNFKSSGFNSTTAQSIYEIDNANVRNIVFNFGNPEMSSQSIRWNGTAINMPLYPGYNKINWANSRFIGTTFPSGSILSLTSTNIAPVLNNITNNTYWFNMTGDSHVKNTYTINYRSYLPSASGTDSIISNTTYEVDPINNRTFNIPFPAAHNTGANEYGEYVFNGYSVNGGLGATPTVVNNTLSLPLNTYGNINITAQWDYQHYANSGTLSAINSGIHTDIDGASRSLSGYGYNFYNVSNANEVRNNIPYTANNLNGPVIAKFAAYSKPGYEFISHRIITYPFGADGSISSIPYNVFITSSINNYNVNTILPAPLIGNYGWVNTTYEIDPKMADSISVGMEMSPFDHPIYVNVGANISSFKYNNEIYNSSWPDTYTFDNKVYYKLNGATFNVIGTYSYNLTNLVTEAGYQAPNKEIYILGSNITNENQIRDNAFVNLPDASLVTYTINTEVGTGVVNASITPNNYTVLTERFTPSITAINKAFGYNTVSIYGNIYNGTTLIQDNLDSIVQIDQPSYNNYSYLLSAVKETFYINKAASIPYGISSYTLSKNNYVISTSKQAVTVSYTMNNGYVMNPSNTISVGNFENSTGSLFYGADQTYNKFNIPASTIGNVIVTPPAPSKIKYNINVGLIDGINGINNMVMNPNNYYISNSTTKQTISAIIGVKPGYDQPTGLLTVSGSTTSNKTNNSFNIDTNGFGDITVTPAIPVINTYNININPISIPTYSVSGISSVTLDRNTYNVESLAFTPGIESIEYTNNGFSGYVINPSFASVPQGSYGDISFNIYANPVTFDITVTKDASITSFDYGLSTYLANTVIDTYNVLQTDKPIPLTNIIVTNQLYLPKANFTIGTVTSGSTGNKSYALSSPLKTNNINIITPLPTGYSTSVLSDNTYTATNSAAKVINITHTMNPGYAQPSSSLIVSNAKSNTGTNVLITSINNRSFTIPKGSWGDIDVTLAAPAAINYQVNFQNGNALNVPTGVNATGFGVTPPNYKVTDIYPREFTLNLRALPGYENPTWRLNGVNKTISDLTFSMTSFNTTPPVVLAFGGNIITYNMNITKGSGINTFKYGTNTYNVSTTVDTYNVLSAKTITLTNISVINSLWKPVGNYDAIIVTAGNISDKVNTVSTELKTNNINPGTLPVGVGSMTITPNNYQAVINSQVRPVAVSYVMNDGYSIPNNMSVVGSLDGASNPVTITPPNGNTFDIAPNTWNNLTVTPSAPTKITYNINDGVIPYGINNLTYSISSANVQNYQISTSARTVSVEYTMNNGYTQPTGNLAVIGGSATVINNRAFSIPINGFGDITVTPNSVSKIQYFINVGTKPNGIDTMTVTPNNYYIDNANVLPVTIAYTANVGWSIPSSNPTVIGSNTTITAYNKFNIATNGYGNILVTSAAPTANIYNIDIAANPKPAAINTWSVSPINYKVTDTYPKTFTITATANTGYQAPMWYINGVLNSSPSFDMPVFSETVPTLQVLEGAVITYDIDLNYTSLNSGITAAVISPTSYNIESPSFTPVISGVTYAAGYSGYNVTPSISQINVGSIGNKSYTIMGTPIEYTISSILGAGINTATLGRSGYNIQETPFVLSWSGITYEPGYSGHTLSGDDLSIIAGTYGNRSYTITGNEITYTVKILNPVDSEVASFDYGGTTYSGTDEDIDTFTVTSPDKVITLTNVVYKEGFSGSSEILFGTITTGSTGNRQYSIGDVNNVYIDLDSWSNQSTTHYKIQSFTYNGNVYDVSNKDTIWIDYFIETDPILTIDLTAVNYSDGYTGPVSYAFGTIDPSVVDTDVTFTMDSTTLITYTAYLQKDDTVTSFRYKTDFLENGALITVSDNTLVEVDFNIQSKLDVSAYNIVYATGYEGNNNGPLANPTTINFDSTNYDRAEDIGSVGSPNLVTYDKLTIYTITIDKTDPESKLTSFNNQIQFSGGDVDAGNTYTILSNDIDVSAIDFVYQTGTNLDGTWTLYTGPALYGFDDTVNTDWVIPSGSTGDKVFTIPVDSITAPAVFNISYTGTSVTGGGYTSEITPQKTSYVYKTGATINHSDENSFAVVTNGVLQAISDRLSSNDPIHYSYAMSSNSDVITVTDTLATISNSDFGDKVIDINWTQVVFSITIKDHYIIRDIYGLRVDVTKPSPISGLTTDQDVFVIDYTLNSLDQDYIITNNIYNKTDLRRTGWTFVNAREISDIGTIEITGTDSVLTGFTVPATWYDNRTMRLEYTPNTYTITLTGADPLSFIYDHEIQKWGPTNVPTSPDQIFDGFEDSSDAETISYSGIYNFANDTYSEDVTFTPKWIDREDFMSYDASSNVVADSTLLENVTINTTDYSRFKENVISPTLVQNIIPDSAIDTNMSNSNTKYMYELLSDYIKFRKLDDYSVVNGYNMLTIISSDLNTYLNTPANLDNGTVIDNSALLTQIENSWSGANATDLDNIGIDKPCDQWSYTANKLGTADVFRIMYKVSDSVSGPFTYWVFDGMIETININNSKQALINKQDMFLINTANGLKEIMKIRDKDNVVIYDRTPNVLDNNTIITNWEDSIEGQSKPVEVFGLLPINKDKVYSMAINMKTSWKSESLVWSGFTSAVLPYSSNARTGEQVGGVDVSTYARIPIRDIYSAKINNTASLTLAVLKNYSVVDDKLVVDNLDSILGPGATEKGALSSDGDFYVPTLYYTLDIDNDNSSSMRTATLNPDTKQYVFTPQNRNINGYVVQGPVSDVNDNLRFLLNDSTGVVNVHVGVLDSNLNNVTSLITLTKEGATDFYKLENPALSLASSDYYTIVIETADRLLYNNLLIYKRFSS